MSRNSRTESRSLRIAVASSGLGHVARGVEAWADDLASALHRMGQNVTLYQGGGRGTSEWRVVLPCGKRTDANVQRWVRYLRGLGGWRYGAGSAYEAEQTTFAFHLWLRVRDDFDILHVQDPWIAYWLGLLHKARISKPRVILAAGTGESLESLRRYPVLQLLAPCYAADYERYKRPSQMVFTIPNFVDTTHFCEGDQRLARKIWNLPQDALIVLCAAAMNSRYKRVDYLIREFAEFSTNASRPLLLVIAGAREAETDEILSLGHQLLPGHVRFFENVPRSNMPSLYQAADVFSLPALNEVFGIVILEALASGLPVACSKTPVLEWIVGKAGCVANISQPGGLSAQLHCITRPNPENRFSQAARPQVLERFSEAAVIPKVLTMYDEVTRWSA